MKTAEFIQIAFNIYAVIFLLWMYFRWSTRTFLNSMMKVSLFCISIVGIICLIKQFNIL